MKRIYKVRIGNRDYTNVSTVDAYSLSPIPMPKELNPVKNKLFNQDIFDITDGNVRVLHSSTRSMQVIPGVLVLKDNKIFGKKKDKFLFKCVPDDKRFPIFVVPYRIKASFSKSYKNKYIVFKFNSWTDDQKHPVGQIVNVLGDVSKLEHFYEYQLYCKSLYASIQNITKKVMKKLKEKTENEYIENIMKKYTLEDHREDRNIFSIDPLKSRDFDDAFSLNENTDETCKISIYISNVAFWMEILDLWDSFNDRITTIYLPDRKRPMLPTVLSDALCSLTENDIRFAFELELTIDKQTNQIKEHQFFNSIIKVKKNLRYDTPEQENYKDYLIIFEIIKKLNKKTRYMDSLDDSHDLVAFMMITMNCICAKELQKYKSGIFRSASLSTNCEIPENLDTDIKKFVKNWNSFGSEYNKFENMKSHDILELDAYVHITSPIRRLADLLNIMIIQEKLGLNVLSSNARKFYNYWTSDNSLNYINKTMRSVRKVQNDCNLLKICSDDNELLQKTFNGFIFDKLVRNDALYQYMVFIPEINMVNRFTTRVNCSSMTNQKFKLFMFEDEINLKKKIRLEIIIE